MNIDTILALSTENTAELLFRHAKMVEESGEFAEAMLVESGYLRHKTLKESALGETADVMICLLDTSRKLYSHLSDQEFKDELQRQLDLKAQKWERIIIAPQRIENRP